MPNDTTDPRLESWLPVAATCDFPIQNLPYGVFESAGGSAHIGVAIGDRVLDLFALAEIGLLDDTVERELVQAPVLNPLLAAGKATWQSLRARLSDLLRVGGDAALRERNHEYVLFAQDDSVMLVPMEIGDYVDFYSSIEHATNLGRLFRPDGDPLLPNWRWIPIGYHGRSSTIVVDGTPVVRPHGQRKPPTAAEPTFGPSARLDIELEMGFVTGPGSPMGRPVSIASASDHIFGLVLVNDWSARDIQAWEYQPLGPFLGKSFATTISPWVVTMDALEPFRVRGPIQEPPPLPYLQTSQAWAFDVNLVVELNAHVVSRTNFKHMYWNMAQQLAHVTSNGTSTNPGDLYASGTISGSEPDSVGSFIEMTLNGQRPLTLPDGETRTFLEDGDEVTLRGWCERDGYRRIGFGAARGRIIKG
jgi:fumarylacetoacetase